MQKFKLYFLLLLCAVLIPNAWATVSEYSFLSSLDTFTEITGGTVLGTATNDNESFNAIPLGFTFTYNGVAYTEVSIQSNGFLAMGSTVNTSYQAISSGTGTNNVVAALNRDIKSRDNGELMYLMTSSATDSVFTVQWKHYRRSATATVNDDFNFQIQLHRTGNKVVYVYGAFSTVTNTAAQAIQVGLRGDSNADFNNRTTSTDWSATNAGTAANNFCVLSATVYPALGLKFTFTPTAAGEPPSPAQNYSPVNNAINVAIAANLSWSSGGGVVDGYKVFLGTDNPPTNIANGTIQDAPLYDPTAVFAYSTTYYWKIVPFNTFGDALNCPVLSFSTLADPTVSVFPHVENFDSVTPTALPPGWTTINANGDNYTWETFAGNAQSQPNSVRIRFNDSLAMNDWLLAPPMQLVQDTYYKVRFYYRASSTTLPERLALYWGNAPTADGLTNQIFAADSILVTNYIMGEGTMQAPSNGIYHFGFKGYSDADMNILYLDSVSISVWVEVLNPPTNLTATVNDHDVHLAWSAPIVNRSLNGYKIYRNTVLIHQITDPAVVSYDDIALTSGLYSYAVSAVYTSGESVGAGPVLADVAPVLAPPINLTATVFERDVTLNWDNPEGDWITWSTMTLGNSVGTGSANVFAVAHRWTQDDLTPVAGRSISRIQFVPVYAGCVYTVKIWTGGSATDAGTLVHSQVVPNPVMNEWNTVLLTALIPIPTTGELYYGYECNTQGGYPAGADAGPPVEGKGNMMYFGGVWTTLTAVAPTLTYNWNLRAFAQYAAPPTAELLAIEDLAAYHLNPEELAVSRFEPASAERYVTGYKVYRDDVLIGTIDNHEITTWLDAALPNATYSYAVTSNSASGESLPTELEVIVNFQLAEEFLADGFETYDDFTLTFAPWTVRDVDHADTNGLSGISFPGSGSQMAYMVFNPSATVPPLTNLTAHGGSKMVASFAAQAPPNNDWIVTPRMHLGTDSAIKFFARSYNNTNGLERFRVGVSILPTIIPQGFTFVTGPDFVEAPVDWTEYVYDLSNWDNQNVYVGIRCVSDSATVFLVDDISMHSDGGSVALDDPSTPALETALLGNYPNPFNPETGIRFQTQEKAKVRIEIYNLRGQLVKRLVDEPLAAGSHTVIWNGTDRNQNPVGSGVYLYKMQVGDYNSVRRMMLIK